MGDLIADAQAWRGGTQIAFMNPGGIRADIAYSSYPHDITWGDFFIVQPFDNKLVTMKLTGTQIYAVLEQQFSPPQSSMKLLQQSGLTYTLRPLEAGRLADHVADAHRRDADPAGCHDLHGRPCNEFIATGGDGFRVFLGGTDVTRIGVSDLDALIEYVQCEVRRPALEHPDQSGDLPGWADHERDAVASEAPGALASPHANTEPAGSAGGLGAVGTFSWASTAACARRSFGPGGSPVRGTCLVCMVPRCTAIRRATSGLEGLARAASTRDRIPSADRVDDRTGNADRRVRRSRGGLDGRGRPRGRAARAARWRVVHCRSRPLRVAAPAARSSPRRSRCSWSPRPRPSPRSRRRRAERHGRRPDPLDQRLPRQPGAARRLLRADRHDQRRRRRVPRDARSGARGDEPEHRRRLRRRPDRREPAPVGALPRRADDRGDEPDRARLQRGRQPRVR